MTQHTTASKCLVLINDDCGSRIIGKSVVFVIVGDDLFRQEFEYTGFLLSIVNLYIELSLLERLANFFVLLKQHSIKQSSETKDGVIFDFILLVDANHVLGPCLQKDPTNEL